MKGARPSFHSAWIRPRWTEFPHISRKMRFFSSQAYNVAKTNTHIFPKLKWMSFMIYESWMIQQLFTNNYWIVDISFYFQISSNLNGFNKLTSNRARTSKKWCSVRSLNECCSNDTLYILSPPRKKSFPYFAIIFS